MQQFDPRPLKVHLHFDQGGRTFKRGNVGKRVKVDDTLCAGNHGMDGRLVTRVPGEVTCKRCLHLMQNPAVRSAMMSRGIVEVRTPATESPPSRPIDFIEPSRLMPHHSIPMIVYCPMCTERHIDEGEFAEKPHHTHACQGCGHVWRPAKVNTHGVRFLPGYKNDS